MLKGYWNGEHTAKFIGVIYRVEKAITETWWQNRVLGTERQGLLITYGGETWLIDNECGDGFYKLTDGLGSPRCGHKSLANYSIIRELPDGEINRSVNVEKLKEEEQLTDQWMLENFPETYKRLQALKDGLKAHTEKYKI